MKIAVVFKWSRDPQDARVKDDASIDWNVAKMMPGDDDHLAMEIARSLVGDGEIVGLTIGDGDKAWAAARGASRTVLVSDALTSLNASVTGETLAAAIRRIGDVDAVLIGDSSWNYGVVSALAGHLGMPAVAGVVSAEEKDGALRVSRKMGNAVQVLDVQGPALLAITANCAEQKTPSMKEVLASRKKPVEQISVSDLGAASCQEAEAVGFRFPDRAPALIFDGNENPETACEQLLAALQSAGVL